MACVGPPVDSYFSPLLVALSVTPAATFAGAGLSVLQRRRENAILRTIVGVLTSAVLCAALTGNLGDLGWRGVPVSVDECTPHAAHTLPWVVVTGITSVVTAILVWGLMSGPSRRRTLSVWGGIVFVVLLFRLTSAWNGG